MTPRDLHKIRRRRRRAHEQMAKLDRGGEHHRPRDSAREREMRERPPGRSEEALLTVDGESGGGGRRLAYDVRLAYDLTHGKASHASATQRFGSGVVEKVVCHTELSREVDSCAVEFSWFSEADTARLKATRQNAVEILERAAMIGQHSTVAPSKLLERIVRMLGATLWAAHGIHLCRPQCFTGPRKGGQPTAGLRGTEQLQSTTEKLTQLASGR
eukprot:CAMPEP_0174239542 /NCGR_PEP_ID=MMETSP0417-20130205/15118_1 /TAXON_ID=242541 /ORGANISM="Mayorella sp, Strain BSH-02190019" /LENGTH=214 /DNA_ID=CAMNT_0015318493 /DNA_START=60 /DNA_END=706 /DNA_ORIENTATION=+